MNEQAPVKRRVRRRRERVTPPVQPWHSGLKLGGANLATLVMMALVLLLPLMMGQRTPEALTATAFLLVGGGLLALLLAGWQGQGREPIPMPTLGWWLIFALLTATVFLQVLPSRWLAGLFGPYPAAFWQQQAFEPRNWSPNVGATLRGWAVFVALFAIAWLAGALGRRRRGWLWLAVVAMALFQGLYGLISHAGGAESILGVWERHNTDFVHGSFSNRNLYAGYLALTWPLAVAVWWLRDVPGLSKLPMELKAAGSVICGAIIGAALMGSASRLGSVAGLIGMITALLLWTRYRGHLKGAAVWPAWAAALAAFLFATWYGLAPLTDRLAISAAEDVRFDVYALMVTEMPARWWLSGVGLGGFEAVFRQVQPAEISGWWDYAHNDLLQWLLEMGLVGLVVLLVVLGALLRHGAIRLERIPLYAGLAALAVVGLGDFSWHIPGTQVVLALYLGVVLQPMGERRHAGSDNPGRNRRRRRTQSDPLKAGQSLAEGP